MGKISAIKLREAADDLHSLQERYLRQRGWEATCQTPGAFWLWKRELPTGEILVVSKDVAMAMEDRASWQLRPSSKSA